MLKSESSVTKGRARTDSAWKHCKEMERGDGKSYNKGNEHGKGHVPPKDAKEAWQLVTMDVGRFFFENGIPINVVTSASFSSMFRSLGDYGRGYKVPSSYDLSTWVVERSRNNEHNC
ncbi:hypothetical protein EZV62_001971 [Acer yangbiense]|uniref:Uncharacterized protein n=1 Tax=Acer yangbiense TaxID=1000413 RepID=A0A5C7IXS0_9ROSI|nr:hypothetical protein EZV62_001971 [Acer yangbiense]